MNPRDRPETIICAAYWVNDGEPHPHQPTKTGLVFCGHRHHNILNQLVVTYGMPPERRDKGLIEHDGFLTSKGRFVGRKEALRIACHAGQVKPGEQIMCDELDSGDLY